MSGLGQACVIVPTYIYSYLAQYEQTQHTNSGKRKDSSTHQYAERVAWYCFGQAVKQQVDIL